MTQTGDQRIGMTQNVMACVTVQATGSGATRCELMRAARA
jgi:hypothetical protein